MLQPLNQTTPTLHQPLHSKVSNYLNNQRRTGQFCDLVLELENSNEETSQHVHYCVVAAQSGFISMPRNSSTQFSINNPLRITITNFNCAHCFRTMMDFFYEDIVSVSKEHETHFMELAEMLVVTELLNLFQITPQAEVECTASVFKSGGCGGGGADEIDATGGGGGGTITLNRDTKAADGNSIFEQQQNYFKLKNPRSTQTSSKINYCIGCDFKCYPVQKMISHMTSCEPAHLTCSLCEVGFLDFRFYDAHLRKHSSDLRKPFICLECDGRFLTRGALIRHLPKHSAETPHVCGICGKGFKWKQGLSNHMLVVHSSEKQMLCDICGYSTSHMKALKSHKLLHTGEFFKCPVIGCNHRANRKENMKLHIETHKQERDFVCEICGCKFSQSKNLKRHALKHTEHGPKRYKCELCGYCNHRSDKIKEHMQRVHTEKAVQLELSEVVESSLENKDDFVLPSLNIENSITLGESTSMDIGRMEKNGIKGTKGRSKRTQNINAGANEKRLRNLLPKKPEVK